MSFPVSDFSLDSETGSLFNPAFCAMLLHRAAKEYEAKSGKPLPVVYAFIVLPCALHLPTRDSLPSSTATSMWGWVRSHPVLLGDFAERARNFRSFTAAAVRFGLQCGALTGELGSLRAGTLRRRPRDLRPTNDWQDCVQAAQFLGRWLAAVSSDEATVLAQWGVRP